MYRDWEIIWQDKKTLCEGIVYYFKIERFKYYCVSLYIMELKTKPRKWGNSLAVILPKVVVEANRIKANQEITLKIETKPTAKELFGILPKWKKPTQKIKDEMRKGW